MSANPIAILRSFDLRRAGALPQAIAAAGLLVLAVTLGGASAAGITANAVLQCAGVIAIAAVLSRRWSTPLVDVERTLLLFAVLFAALYLLQLVPLPPAVWTVLPGRAVVAEGFDTLGIARPWMPLSLAPAQTLRSGLALLSPIAVLLMILRFQRPVGRAAVAIVLGAMIVSLLLGVAQYSGSDLYFYTNTNGGSATGFFANANHFATLMCLAMPLAAGLVTQWRGDTTSRAFGIAMLLAIVLLGLLGVAMTKSIAGLLLAVVAVVGSAAIALNGLSRNFRLAFLGGVLLAVLVAGFVISTGMLNDFIPGSVEFSGNLSRPMMWGVTAQAWQSLGISGSGFGSFQQVFHLFEDPMQVTTVFANHAHNDLLELALEGGIPALILLVAFLLWFARRVAQIWLTERRRDTLAQGASIAAIIVLLHSLVDYPLRTGAIATIFALCLALMARGSADSVGGEEPTNPPAGRHLSA